MTKTFSAKIAGVHNEMLAAKSIRASSCNILQMIFLSANSRRALAFDVDGFRRNQCIILQQEFARELGEISPSVCSFGVDAAYGILTTFTTNDVLIFCVF